MAWRSQRNSNPCFRRERAALIVRHGSSRYAMLFDMSRVIPACTSPLFAVDRHDTPPSTGHKLDTRDHGALGSKGRLRDKNGAAKVAGGAKANVHPNWPRPLARLSTQSGGRHLGAARRRRQRGCDYASHRRRRRLHAGRRSERAELLAGPGQSAVGGAQFEWSGRCEAPDRRDAPPRSIWKNWRRRTREQRATRAAG